MPVRRFGSYSLKTSNESKVFFPASGITKGDLLDYYQAVAGAMIPLIQGRPLSFQRFPEGIGREGFFQQQADGSMPDWVKRVEIEKVSGGKIEHAMAFKAADLASFAQIGAVVIHQWQSRQGRLLQPDHLVFDLDPSIDEGFDQARQAALILRDYLEALGLVPFVKTTGSRGLHVVAPLAGKEEYDEVRRLCSLMAGELVRSHPDELTTEQRKNKRQGRVYLEVGRNAYGQTMVAPYSVRAREGAPVSAPVDWEELEDQGFHPEAYTLESIPARMGRRPCPWRAMHRRARSLNSVRRRLESQEMERNTNQ